MICLTDGSVVKKGDTLRYFAYQGADISKANNKFERNMLFYVKIVKDLFYRSGNAPAISLNLLDRKLENIELNQLRALDVHSCSLYDELTMREILLCFGINFFNFSKNDFVIIYYFFRRIGHPISFGEMDNIKLNTTECSRPVYYYRFRKFIDQNQFLTLNKTSNKEYILNFNEAYENRYRGFIMPSFKFHGITLGYKAFYYHGIEYSLSDTQYKILFYLFNQSGQQIPFAWLLQFLKSEDIYFGKRVLDVQIATLRTVIRNTDVEIVTIFSKGYSVRKKFESASIERAIKKKRSARNQFNTGIRSTDSELETYVPEELLPVYGQVELELRNAINNDDEPFLDAGRLGLEITGEDPKKVLIIARNILSLYVRSGRLVPFWEGLYFKIRLKNNHPFYL